MLRSLKKNLMTIRIMNNKAEKILKNIKEKKIKPKAKWLFLVRNYLVWLMFGLAIFIGAIATSVIIFSLTSNDWDLYKVLEKNFVSFAIISIPYIWVIVLILFSLLSYFNYKHTKTGYRVEPIKTISLSVVLSIVLGSVLFMGGFGEFIDYKLSKDIPYYEKMMAQRQLIWNNPEKGLLAGKIIEMNNKNDFYINSLSGEKWHIIGNDILWKGRANGKEGEKIKIIGRIMGDKVFVAEEIRPWFGRGFGAHSGNGKHSNITE